MFTRFTRILALAFTAAAVGVPVAHAMPVEPVGAPAPHSATSQPAVTSYVGSGSDAAQRQASPAVRSSDRSDAAQISPADHVVLRGRPASPAPAPSHVSAPADDGIKWGLAGTAALIALCVAGAAVALRPRFTT